MKWLGFPVPSISPPEQSMWSIMKTQVTLTTITLGSQGMGRRCDELKCVSHNRNGSGRKRRDFIFFLAVGCAE